MQKVSVVHTQKGAFHYFREWFISFFFFKIFVQDCSILPAYAIQCWVPLDDEEYSVMFQHFHRGVGLILPLGHKKKKTVLRADGPAK